MNLNVIQTFTYKALANKIARHLKSTLHLFMRYLKGLKVLRFLEVLWGFIMVQEFTPTTVGSVEDPSFCWWSPLYKALNVKFMQVSSIYFNLLPSPIFEESSPITKMRPVERFNWLFLMYIYELFKWNCYNRRYNQKFTQHSPLLVYNLFHR